ncbi:MAG: hypothetical protein EB141_06180 [Verrucomicrobia bacterium]|nr:hypothetical protein [Verrucomicrobiota bacterium]NBU11287.1 hypothetical protein [Pseudomonadota bacterium]NDB75220.1 hypothetical protein [Verrucomicrobiota bacterium]NDD37442.1 hypothetical protein [Verrucomicrobiota bacterium]NDE97063.1 hypothetical protein [Verrucomicrobiota bacterium]
MPSSKPFSVVNCEQRSDAWRQSRAGVFTASKAHDAFWKTQKGEYRAERRNYRTQLVLERVTGKPTEDGYQSKAMLDGIKREALALRQYENIHGVLVRSVGFVLDNEIPVGCSPDGMIGDFEGLVQAKCPMQATHFATVASHRAAQSTIAGEVGLVRGCIAPEYLAQIRHELFVTGAAWCDYFSFHPDFPEPLRSVTIRVTREDAALEQYAQDVRTFLDEVEAECEKIAGWMAA